MAKARRMGHGLRGKRRATATPIRVCASSAAATPIGAILVTVIWGSCGQEPALREHRLAFRSRPIAGD
jgi:hypothetical protein